MGIPHKNVLMRPTGGPPDYMYLVYMFFLYPMFILY